MSLPKRWQWDRARPTRREQRFASKLADRFALTRCQDNRANRLGVEALEARVLLAGTPIITEFMAQNATTLVDDDNQPSDWIEITNPDPTPLDLGGWFLTDSASNLTKWAFPAIALNPAQSIVVFASNQNRANPAAPLHTNFRLDADGEYLALVRPDGITVAQAFDTLSGRFPPQVVDVSYGLVTGTNQQTYFLTPTPGSANSGPTTQNPTADIVITEIMFHPLGETPAEEFIELYNRGASTVDLSAWQIADGATFTFPAGTTIAAGGYLTVAANVATFNAKHPGVSNVVGGWTGELSNTGESIDLRDSAGNRIDRVEYADQGDWAVRRRGELDHNHRGWEWETAADGGGSSLERVSLTLSNNSGQNWAASAMRGGTPGAANSATDGDVAPLIADVKQSPEVPRSTDVVTITARLTDEAASGVSATLFYRIDGAASFSNKPMFDDGLHGDGAAGDRVFGATLNPAAAGDFSRALTNLDVVEFYVRASDAALNQRTWPAPALLGPQVVGHWSFEEGIGTTTVDLTGNGNDGRLTDGASFLPPGRFGKAVNLDGSDDRVVVEPRIAPEPPLGLESFTLAIWFQRTGNGIVANTGGFSAEPLIAKGRDLGSDGGLTDLNYFLGLTNSGGNWVLAADFEEHVATANPGANHPLVGATAIADDTWNHAAVTYDGATMRLYLNGNLEGTLAVSRTPNWESTQLATLGSTVSDVGAPLGGFRGLLDEAYILDGAMSASDLAGLISGNSYTGGPMSQSANALYQVDNGIDSGAQPTYRMILTAAEQAELAAISAPATCADIMNINARCDARSDAQMNATFTATAAGAGGATEVRYTAGVRLRGNNTRVQIPAEERFSNYRVNIPTDHELDGRSALNLNARDTESQLAGSVLWKAAGLPAADARAVQLRINGANQLSSGNAPHYGSYVHVEAFDSDFTDDEFPGDGNGNFYRAVRNTRPSPDVEADFAYLGANPDAYRLIYPKSTNEAADDWSDLINLTNVFTNSSDAAFAAAIANVIDVDQWLRYLALDALLSNDESGLQSGIGDDFALYRGVNDPRFILIPRDLDTLLGRGNTPVDFDENSIWGATGAAALDRLLKHPQFAPRFLQQMRDLANTILAPASAESLLGNALGGFVPQATIDAMRTFLAARINWIFSTQINQALTVVSPLPLDTAWNRLRRTTANTTTLSGQIDAIDTMSVIVSGVAATISNWQGTWSAANIALNPGINRIVVDAFDGPGGTGKLIGSTSIDVWYDISTGSTGASVSVPAGAVWKYRDNGVLPANDAEGDTWKEHDYNDAAWAQGPAQLGYGENDQATTIDCGPGPASDCAPGNTSANKYITSYFRNSFTIAAGDAAKLDTLSYTVTYDDGAVVYINGTDVGRFNMAAAPAVIGNATLATGNGENTITTRTLDLSLPQWAGLLHDGVNTIAVEVHQDSTSSSDISFNLSMTAQEIVQGGGTAVPAGNLTGNITWSPENGPYHLSGNVVVPAGSTLNILPGTSIFFDAGVRLTVSGILNAQGTRYQRIRFSTTPGTALVADIRPQLPLAPPHWGGVHVDNSNSPLNIVSHADFEYAQPTESVNDGSIAAVNGSQLLLDDITNFGSHLRWIYGRASSMIIRNSVLYDMYENCDCPAGHPQAMTPAMDNIAEQIKAEGGIPVGGYFIVEGNVIGRNRGHNDNIDVDSGQWPNPILQIRNNIFLGTGDEAQDGGGDFLFEGNIVGDFRKDIDNDGTGDSNVITTGDTASTVAMIVRNTFTKIDHVVNFKTGAYGYLESNTIVGIAPPRQSQATDPPLRTLEFSAINFLIPNETNPLGGNPRDWPPGLGAYTAGNIFVDIPETVFGHVDFMHNNQTNYPFTPQILELHNSLVPNAGVLANADGHQGRVFDYLVGDPRFLDSQARDYRLGPGSPAIGTGPNGLDMGAMVASGASISGEPPAVTASTSATLHIGGPGVIAFQYRVNGGAWSSDIKILDPRPNISTPVKTRIVDLPLTGLANGTYQVEVRGRNYAGDLQATPTASKTWTVDTALHRVEISEVLASNVAALAVGAAHPDLIELHNPGATAFDLSGMSISDNPNQPQKFVFAAGATIPAGGYLVLYADGAASSPGQIQVGFSLKSNEGDGVYLYDAAQALVDSVEFGIQLNDRSIARLGHDGEWGLALPTFGSANVAALTGDPRNLQINEWFTAGSYTIAGETHTNDFVELSNRDTLPVALGGLHLTDNFVAEPDKFTIAPLSFIAGGALSVFTADGDTDRGVDHLNFQLADEQGEIGLFAADGQTRLDYVIYGPQRAGDSQGRIPGSPIYQFFTQPSPGVVIDSTPPSIPQNLHFTANTATHNDLAWDASTDAESAIDHYNVYRNGELIGSPGATSFSDTAITADQIYQYRVSAVNADGAESALSASIKIGSDATPPSVPVGLGIVEALAAANINLTLTWSASTDAETGVKNYRVYRNNVLIGTTASTTLADNAVAATTTLEYRVAAVNNDDVESAHSEPIFVAQLQNGVSQNGAYNGNLDAWIDENNPTAQNGDATTVRADGADPLEEMILMRWNLSSIPSGAVVQRSSVIVNVTDNSAGQNYNFYELKRDWVENQATFQRPSLAGDWETDGARGPSDRGAVSLGAIGLANVTVPSRRAYPLNAAGAALVGDWISGATPNYGFLIAKPSAPTVDNGLVLSSSEAAAAGERPLMLVVYTTTTTRVTGVKVRGASWSPAMLARLQADGAGTGGYNLPSAAATAGADTLPWSGVSEIAIAFSAGVVAQATSLQVHGVNVANYPIASYAFDTITNTATWTLTTPIVADKIRLVLDDSVVDGSGNPLDGEPGATFPSGNSAPGGDFQLRFNVLPGDSNKSGAVDSADLVAAIRGSFVSSTAPEYVAAHDINADGKVNFVDAVFTRNQLGAALPAGEPSSSPEAPAALVVEVSASGREAIVVAGPRAGLRIMRQRVRMASAVDASLDELQRSPSAASDQPNDARTRTLRAARSRTIAPRVVDAMFDEDVRNE